PSHAPYRATGRPRHFPMSGSSARATARSAGRQPQMNRAIPTDGPRAGRVALVTGASRGVGRGVAGALGAAGWTVYLTGRAPAGTDDPLGGAAAAVSAAGGSGHPVVCEHADDNQVQATLD